MTIKDWPEAERPREKLLARGVDVLSDAELLAIFLCTGISGRSAVDIGRDMLSRFGGLRALLRTDLAGFCAVPGLGRVKYAQLQAAYELGRRCLAEGLHRDGPLTSPRAAQEYLRAHLRDRTREVFCCIYLDNRHQVLACDELFQGTIDGATVHPREVVKRALVHNAAAVIAAHNHPSGVAEPSRADENLTRRLKEALALLDIRLLDHLVVGDTECVSLSERGFL